MNNKVIFNALQGFMSGGIGRYSYELALEMYKLLGNKLIIVIREEDVKYYANVSKESLIIAKGINSSLKRNLYEQINLPRLIMKKYPNAIVHYPDTMAPLLIKNDVVITIHDLAFKSLKGVFTKKTALWKNLMTNLSVRKAKRIIAITNFTKSEIDKHFSKKISEKVQVVYNGFNNFSSEEIEISEVREKIKAISKTEYILTVSTISPRKNIDTLIKVMDIIRSETNKNLVVAGAKGWMYESIYKLVSMFELEERIIFTDKINDEELKILYKNSKVFIYISKYEGFGLPPLEAMSYGIPCIVSNTTSLPEVVGNAAVKVDPDNMKEIKEELLNIHKKKELVILSNENLKRFNWKKCTNETLRVVLGDKYDKY